MCESSGCIGIVDYGVGNLRSIERAVQELGESCRLIRIADEAESVSKLILPGVGNYSECMAQLTASGWDVALKRAVNDDGKLLLGICVGMQLLAESGEEGSADVKGTAGLGFVPGRVVHLRSRECGLRVPHVGWNTVSTGDHHTELFAGIPPETDFYFVHSYVFVPGNYADTLATTEYGVDFTAAVGRGRVFGTQFHPEKSSKAGRRLLHNFVRMT